MLGLVTEKAVEVFDPFVVKFAGVFNQQQIYAGNSKYVNGQVIQLLHFWDLRDGRGGIDPLKVQTMGWGSILVSLGDVVAVDMPAPPEAPIEDSGHPCFSR